MKKYLVTAVLVLILGFVCVIAAHGVTIDTVTVGNPNNAADATGYGSVADLYAIGKYEITASQYCEFLKAVARTDNYELYNPNMLSSDYGCKIQQTGSSGSFNYSVAADWANRPVNFVSWGDAARFCNWVQNNQPTGSQDLSTTEDGAYFLNGITSDAALMSVTRKSTAKWWIPSENEWYKAAYHKNDGVMGNYFQYPTSSNTTPSNNLVEPIDPGNNATFWDTSDFTIGSPYYRTVIGAHENSDSPYHTFDQGGNVMEWNEAVISDPYGGGPSRGLRGGSFLNTSSNLAATDRDYYFPPTTEGLNIGFRVASVPSFNWISGSSTDPTDWGLQANWDPSTGVPNGPGTKVSFGKQSTDHDVVDMILTGRTVGSIDFASTTSTTIESSHGFNLTLNNNGSASIINVAGNHTISAPVSLSNDLNINGPGTLDLTGGISGPYAVHVLSGNVTAKSINVDALTVGSGVVVTIRAMPGGPLGRTIAPVPEPSTFVILGMTMLSMFAYVWRRRK